MQSATIAWMRARGAMRRGVAIVAAVPAVLVLANAAAPHPAAVRSAAPPAFVRHLIPADGFAQVVESVAVGDLNRDRRPDIVVAGDHYLLWYAKPGGRPQLLARGSFGAGAATLVRDLDGDGRADVVTGETLASGAEQEVWFANTTSGWRRHLLSSEAYCHDLVLRPAEGVCVDQHNARIGLLTRDDASPFAPWSFTSVQDGVHTMGLAVADIDRDGKPDIVAGRSWYRDEGSGVWSRHPYTTLAGAYPAFDDFAKVAVLDLNGDGRPDIVASLFAESPAGRLFAFLAPRDPRTQTWTPVRLDAGPLFGVHSLVLGRLDGCARPELVVAETNIGGWSFGVAPDPHIYAYRLLGAASTPAGWSRTVVDSIGAHDVTAADLNGDGRPDLVGHEENTDLLVPPRDGRVYWWQNVTPRRSCP